MKYIETDIKGVLTGELNINSDQRGWLIELFRSDILPDGFNPAMSYVSLTHPGVVRGPHEHKEQSDYLVFIGSSEFKIFLWDNRTDSSTNRQSMILEAKQSQPLAVIIPPGVVHGYKNIGTSDGLTINFPNRLYAGENKTDAIDEIRYEDNPESPFKID